MKVVCDNCRAVYKIPDQKLTKAVNKATCRQCGHRMLIPKPKPGASPDERVLVTAVPPTPKGAPRRDDGPHTAPIREEEPEETLPGPAPVGEAHRSVPARPPAAARPQGPAGAQASVFPGTPLPAFRGGDDANRPGPSPASLADTAIQPPPDPASSAAAPKAATPAPKPRATPAPSARRGTPAPAFARSEPAHDPSGDLSWALLGVVGGMVGAFMLAVLSVVQDPLLTRLVMWFGLALSFGGGALAVLVLVTSQRGRRPARTLASALGGGAFAVFAASTLVSLQVATSLLAEDAQRAAPLAGATPPGAAAAASLANAAPEVPEEPEVPDDAAADAQADAAPADEPQEAEAPEEAPADEPDAPALAAAAAPRPAPKPAAAATPKPAPRNDAAAPAPRAAPKPAPPAPEPQAMSSVPLVAVDTMLKNNLHVKKCFVPLFQAGTLPPRVNVRLTIQPTGQATDIGVIDPQYAGTDFDRCLGAAIASITFPPSQTATKIDYPFILQ